MKNISVNSIAAAYGMRLSEIVGNKQQENMLIYGAEVLLCSFIKVILIVVLSSLMGIFKETVTIVITSGLFRMLTGGIHATAYYRCLIISLFVFLSLGFLLNTSLLQIVNHNFLFLNLPMLFGLYWIIRYAPNPPINKPLKGKNDYRNRKVFAVLIYLGVMVSLNIIAEWWIVAVSLGLTWQAFTLTRFGHIVIGRLDAMLTIIERKEVDDCEAVS